MSKQKAALKWSDIMLWMKDYPVLAAFLIALVIVIIVGVAFLINVLVGLVVVGVGAVLAALTFIIYCIIDYNSF